MSYKTDKVMAEYIEQRNMDFMRGFREELRAMLERGEPATVDGVIEKLLEGDAPGYYVSYRYARRAVGDLIDRGVAARDMGGIRRHSRRDMMLEIARKCIERMNARGISLGRALVDVLACERASSWFITRAYARQLYYNTVKKSKRGGRRI